MVKFDRKDLVPFAALVYVGYSLAGQSGVGYAVLVFGLMWWNAQIITRTLEANDECGARGCQ